MDAFEKVKEQINTMIRTILGSPNPEESSSVIMRFDNCDDRPDHYTVQGINPHAESKGDEVFKTLNCEEVDELLALYQSLQQFAGAS